MWAAALERRWDVVPVVIQDPTWEQSFPDVGGVVVPIADPASGALRYARFSRRDLLTDLTQLVPAIHRLGGTDADQALARSARDVSRWWP